MHGAQRGWAQHGRTLVFGLGLGAGLWALATAAGWLVESGLQRYTAHAGALGQLVFFLLLGVALQRLLGSRRRSAARLRQLSRAVEQSPSTVMITDLRGRIEYVNPKFTELTGYSLDEARGQNPRILKSGHTPPEVYAEMWRAISSGGAWRGEFHNVKKNGELYWEAASLSAIRNGAGRITHYLAVKEDITARKAAEVAEREQRRLAEALRDAAAVLNSAQDVHAVLDQILAYVGPVVPHDMALVLLMDEARRLAHVVRRRGGPGQTTSDAAPDRGDAVPVHETAHLRWVLERRFSHIIADTRTDPAWAPQPGAEWIRSQAVMPIRRENEVIGFLVLSSATPDFFQPEVAERLQGFADQVAVALRNATHFDALQQYAAELEERVAARTAALRQGRSQLQAILDGMGEGVIYFEHQQVVYTNRALLRMLRLDDHPDPHGALIATMRQREDYDALLAEMQRHFSERAIWRKQINVHLRDDSPLELALTAAPVPSGPDGAAAGVVLIVRDISQEAALEAQKERFLTHAAHELRTPITNLKMRLYLARTQPERREFHLDIMERAVDRITALAEDLLDMLRLSGDSALEREVVELGRLVTAEVEAQQDSAAAHGVTLSWERLEVPVCVQGDPERLAQAVDRLLINAIHQTPAGGAVNVTLRADARESARHAVLLISDNAEHDGFADGSQVFEPFYSASQGSGVGLGLGLSIAREIVRLHDGTLTLDQCAGGTRVFSVRLALHDALCE